MSSPAALRNLIVLRQLAAARVVVLEEGMKPQTNDDLRHAMNMVAEVFMTAFGGR